MAATSHAQTARNHYLTDSEYNGIVGYIKRSFGIDVDAFHMLYLSDPKTIYGDQFSSRSNFYFQIDLKLWVVVTV